MLESMRNAARSWLAKLILGGIAFSFALWGIGDYFLGSRVETVAEVDGKPITDSEFAAAYQRQIESYRNVLGKRFSRELLERFHVKDDTLQTLINRRIMLAEADRLRLVAPRAVLVARIQATPAFRNDKGFDPARYRALLRMMGYANPRDFEDEERLNMMVDALQQAVMRSATVSERDLRDRFEQEYERRVLEALIVDPERMKKGIEPKQAELRRYYDAHKEEFRSPRKVALAVVVIDPAQYVDAQKVRDQEIADYYRAHEEEFRIEEQRRARHILIKVAENAPDAQVAAARKRIEAIRERLKKGEKFADLAREASEDSGSAKQGGDLGFFGRGAMVPAFEKAVFALKKGEVSDIVRSRFGFHLIKVTDVRPARRQGLDEVKEKILRTLKRSKAADAAYRLSQELDDALGREGNLADAARAVDLPIKRIGPISREEAAEVKLLADNPELRKRAFRAKPDDAVEVTELDDGRYVALAVTRIVPPAVEPFDRVVERVRAALIDETSRKKARELADKVRAQAADGTSIDQLAKAFHLTKARSKPVRRNGMGESADWITGAVLKAAFAAPAGRWLDGSYATPAGFAVVRVASVIAPDDKLFDDKREALRSELAKSKGAVRFARWMSSVRKRHDIEIHPEAIRRF
ncbi:MAG: peptidyl-prolyl cis-trans isomerase [Zetaproteobacteria bacterium]|nr:MAG: peptidyl-prolyl cis-trans isomerase [Zetaproteobacteria bacterium]